MKKKSSSYYRALIDGLKQWAIDHNRVFAPAKIRCDFEAGFISAVHQELPTTTITGCYFHFCQAVYRKLAELGLSADYVANDDFRKRVRMMLALAFLPVAQATVEFQNTIVVGCPPVLLQMFTPLADYFRNYWIPRAELWNMANVVRRTNNNVEGWNSRFSKLVARHHPDLWRFLTALIKEQQHTKLLIIQLDGGQQVNQQNPKYKKVNARIDEIKTQFATQLIDVPHFLAALAHVLAEPTRLSL
jgi:hypothetical protein